MGKRKLSPREARDRFIAQRESDSTQWTIRCYRYRLKAFVEWCEENDIETVDELDGWLLDEYLRARQATGNKPITVKGKMNSVRLLLRYCARIELVDDDLPEKVPIPSVSNDEESSDEKLHPDDAEDMLTFYRRSREYFGMVEHALLELLWHTGARKSGVRALDLEDYHEDEQFVEFVHRPPETGLKNDGDGERAVALPAEVCEALDVYIARERWDKRDEEGREPLFTTRQGRASDTTLQSWCYAATQPCVRQRCPHGNRQETCDYRDRNHLSKCPSSRAPHAVRTGSITWQRDRGVPLDVVAERVNASPAVIKRHYDKHSHIDEMEHRRRDHVEKLGFDG
jgi:site-specific recombinase XerD